MSATCPACGMLNGPGARFCTECGLGLSAEAGRLTGRAASVSRPADARPVSQAGRELARGLTERVTGPREERHADIMFVLDHTGSMRGELNTLKDAIVEFADTIESEGVRARVGMVAFLDRLVGLEHRLLTFNGAPFTSDVAAFRREVSALRATPAGTHPESSLDALMLALRQPFAPDGHRVLVLITDAPPNVPDKETRDIDEVVARMREVGITQVYPVIRTQDPDSQVYLKLLDGIQGLTFDLGRGNDFRARAEDFKLTLMQLGKTLALATRTR